MTKGTAGVVGRRCVPFGEGAGGGVKIGGGVQVSDNSMCTSRRWRSGVARCFAEGMGLLAAVAGWRMSSWFGDTGVLFVLAGLLDYCRSVSDRVVVHFECF